MFSNDLRQLGASRIQYYSLTSQSQHPVSRRTVRSFARSFIRRRQEWWCEQRRNETVSTRAHNLTGSSRATSILLWPLCLFVDGRIEMGTYIIDRYIHARAGSALFQNTKVDFSLYHWFIHQTINKSTPIMIFQRS